jgi:DNA-directed RNA polymerase specialized sigma24 family protein
LDPAERERCLRVWNALTHRQQEVLQAFASGLGRQEAAQQLHVSVATIDSHRDRIIAQCRLVWDDQAGEEFNSRFLERRFAPFLAGHTL